MSRPLSNRDVERSLFDAGISTLDKVDVAALRVHTKKRLIAMLASQQKLQARMELSAKNRASAYKERTTTRLNYQEKVCSHQQAMPNGGRRSFLVGQRMGNSIVLACANPACGKIFSSPPDQHNNWPAIPAYLMPNASELGGEESNKVGSG